MMKKIVLAALFLAMACGMSQRDSELIGQVKKVSYFTPLVCMNHYAVDVSLGVMRNGVGSMSTQDVWLYVWYEDNDLVKQLKAAAESGALVKVKYNEMRINWCVPEKEVVSVQEVK